MSTNLEFLICNVTVAKMTIATQIKILLNIMLEGEYNSLESMANWHPEDQENKKEQRMPDGGRIEYPTNEGDKVELVWQVSRPTQKRLRSDVNKNPELLDTSEVELSEKLQDMGVVNDGDVLPRREPFVAGPEDYVAQAGEDEAVIFLPGVALEGDSGPVVESGTHFANASQAKTYTISTRLGSPTTENFQEIQAQAILKFITEQGLKKITIVGNSQGANKGIDLAWLIQEANKVEGATQIEIEGLVLTSPGGIIEQDEKELTKNFFKDSLGATTLEVVSQAVKNPTKYKQGVAASSKLGASVAYNMAKEAVRGQLAKRTVRESKEAAKVNEHARELEVPVVLVVGEKDAAFNADKFVPEIAHDQSLWSQQKREEKMMQEVFHNANGVRVLKAQHNGVHGVHYFREDQIANATMYMLKRMNRGQALERE